MGEWLNWTACDKECGSGYRQRERNCDNPLPKGNGKDCTGLGNLTQTEACKVKECPGILCCQCCLYDNIRGIETTLERKDLATKAGDNLGILLFCVSYSINFNAFGILSNGK